MRMQDLKNHFVTADTHFGHEFVSDVRGFSNTVDHDKSIVSRFNEVLSPESTLIVVGDAAMNAKDLAPFEDIEGKKVLIAGNHDTVWHRRDKPGKVRKAISSIFEYSMYFDEIYTSGVRFIELQDLKEPVISGVVVSHLPVSGDHKDANRYNEMRPKPGVEPVLSGHVHGAWRTSHRHLNVGVDVNDFTPLPMREAIREAIALPGGGASKDVSLEGPWSAFGLA